MIFRYKIAALTEAEQAEFKQVIRNHADFDQKAGLGDMSAEMKEAMRHNVERIKAYRAKKANDSATIPAWARNPTGKPPIGGPRAPSGGPRSANNAGTHGSRTNYDWDEAYRKATERARRARETYHASDTWRARDTTTSYHNPFPEAKAPKPNPGAARLALAGLTIGIVGLNAYSAYKSDKKPKVKDTERSDKGKKHKKNYSYHAPDMKKAASY